VSRYSAQVSRVPRVLTFFISVALFATTAAGATRYDPRLRFRVISTPRFDILFHQGEDAQARRLAVIVEEVAARLDRTLGPPAGRVHVILVAQSDLPNGWATPVPYNLIEIAAAAPSGESEIGNTDDWLRLVFAHEYTHVVHLSRSGGWIHGLQRVFGRLPVLYPNLFTPIWQIEGLAVFEESALTGHGRMPNGEFRMIVDSAVRASAFDPLDRASGGLVDWPGGNAAYVYGAYFHEFLATRYGPDTIRRLTDETSRRVPYFGSPAYRKVFGRSLGKLWADYEADVRTRAAPTATLPTRLTHHGFDVGAPRFSPDGRIYYSTTNPHGFPALMSVSPGQRPEKLADKYLGNRIAFAGRSVVFDAIEVVHHVALQSDLYRADLDGSDRRRLTHGARAADPDVSSDGRTIACTVQQPDRRDLATMEIPPEGRTSLPVTLLSEAGTDFSAPRWSPDGRLIAAERQRLGGLSEVVLIDPHTAAVRTLAASATGRNVAPAWLPDSKRIVFASDRDGGPFRLFTVDVDGAGLRRLEDTGGSAQMPDVARDGSSIVFVGYTLDGYDLFSLPLTSARWTPVEHPPAPAPAARSQEGPGASPPSDVRSYSPFRTIAPRFWTPVIESDAGEILFGAAVGSADALGYHSYAANVAWSGSRGRPDWDVAYAYDRWRPILFVDASDDTDPFRDGEIRSREVNGGMLLPFRRVRWSQLVLASFHAARDRLVCTDCGEIGSSQADRAGVRGGWAFSSARKYGYSISPEDGAGVIATADLTRRALGADGDANAVTIDGRVYIGAWPQHGVIAARVAAATSWGERDVRREFSASGSGPQPGGFRFGFDAIGLLRGFPDDDALGPHAAVINLDYRVPLLRIERGAGTLPAFARTLHGTVFVDAGHVWDESFRASDARVAIGGELSLDVVLGYSLPLRFTGGASWRHDPSGRERGAALFGRIGTAF
jgi:Tol biopolymer transport system component